jgi:hypothetical protein
LDKELGQNFIEGTGAYFWEMNNDLILKPEENFVYNYKFKLFGGNTTNNSLIYK